ncbi:MAG TPA: hypothetical protein VFQ35_03380, partial [Polyangiaceae bacterium]|nr:hypothetical protein [Polyangiaceae bacterium]
VSSGTVLHEDTLDPWRVASWTRVRSGLDTARVRPTPQRAARSSPAVSSGLDVPATSATDEAHSWIHSDIIDPWAGRALRQ